MSQVSPIRTMLNMGTALTTSIKGKSRLECELKRQYQTYLDRSNHQNFKNSRKKIRVTLRPT